MTEIEALAKIIQDGLDTDEQKAASLLNAARKIDATPDFFGAGGPAAEAFWQRFTEGRILAEVALKRSMVNKLLAESHSSVRAGSTEIYCAADADTEYECACDRDNRVRTYLQLLTQPYQETT